MDYNNRVKGSITQTIVKSILEDAGYHVVPLGIEEVLRELKQLNPISYLQLGLPSVLRKLPDFFITDLKNQKHWLLEVKYRRQWNATTHASLEEDLLEQAQKWGPFSFLLLLGHSTHVPSPGYEPSQMPRYRLGVTSLKVENSSLYASTQSGDKAWPAFAWEDFFTVQDYFPNVFDRWRDETLIKAVEVLDSLSSLDLMQ